MCGVEHGCHDKNSDTNAAWMYCMWSHAPQNITQTPHTSRAYPHTPSIHLSMNPMMLPTMYILDVSPIYSRDIPAIHRIFGFYLCTSGVHVAHMIRTILQIFIAQQIPRYPTQLYRELTGKSGWSGLGLIGDPIRHKTLHRHIACTVCADSKYQMDATIASRIALIYSSRSLVNNDRIYFPGVVVIRHVGSCILQFGCILGDKPSMAQMINDAVNT